MCISYIRGKGGGEALRDLFIGGKTTTATSRVGFILACIINTIILSRRMEYMAPPCWDKQIIYSFSEGRRGQFLVFSRRTARDCMAAS